jgi:RNA recognition motif-containing protein
MGTRLYVGNLSLQTTEQALMAAFGRVGAVSELRIVTDREHGRSRGFGFVLMADAASARKAITKLDGAIVDGRPLRVSEAENRPQPEGGQSHSAFGNRGRSC